MCDLPMKRKDGTPIHWESAPNFNRYLISDTGLVYSLISDKMMPQVDINGRGYLLARIYTDDGRLKQMRIHRLVYMAHRGAIPDGMQINHKDECKTNNCIENLEVVTCKQNINYGTANKRRAKSIKKYYRERKQAMACS